MAHERNSGETLAQQESRRSRFSFCSRDDSILSLISQKNNPGIGTNMLRDLAQQILSPPETNLNLIQNRTFCPINNYLQNARQFFKTNAESRIRIPTIGRARGPVSRAERSSFSRFERATPPRTLS